MNISKIKKLFKYLLIASVLISGLFILILPYLNGKHQIFSFAHSKIYNNEVEINVNGNLSIDKVNVIFRNENSFDRNLKYALIKNQKILIDTIVKNGVLIHDVPYDYGKQYMEVYYDNLLIGEFGHWKTNNYKHHYKIELSDNDSLYFKGTIVGHDQDFNNWSHKISTKEIEKRRESLKSLINLQELESKVISNGYKRGISITHSPSEITVKNASSSSLSFNKYYALLDIFRRVQYNKYLPVRDSK